MPNVTISATTFDPSGAVTIKALPSSDYGTTARRMNRIATLDGGSVTNDFGFSEADKTMRIDWQQDRATDEAVERMVQLHARVYLSTNRGMWLAAVESFRPGNTSQLNLMPVEKLA